MKNSTKKILTTLILITIISLAVKAQTNVSGGIYSNTTWTKANSPYIVVDTTVVFPGVTLTIEPGVTVKFDDHIYLEIRQATLVATGTITDSITFTSNSPTPTPGIWGHQNYGGIYFNCVTNLPFINYWNISYAITGISTAQYQPFIKNSTFTHNLTGIQTVTQTPIDSCVFKYNEKGISVLLGNTSNVVLNNCIISNNSIGVEDVYKAILNNCTLDSNYRAIGGLNGSFGSISTSKFYNCSFSYNHDGFMTVSHPGGNLLQHCILNFNTADALFLGSITPDSVVDCQIKYNGTGATVYTSAYITQCDIEFDTIGLNVYSSGANIYCTEICNNISYGLKMLTSNNFNASNNFWCTSDSTQIAAAIYDGYDNISLGLVTFLPVNNSCFQSTGITETNDFSVSVFPNPFNDELSISINNHQPVEVILYDITSRILLQKSFTNSTILNTQHLAKGMYLYELRNKTGVIKKGKVVKD